MKGNPLVFVACERASQITLWEWVSFYKKEGEGRVKTALRKDNLTFKVLYYNTWVFLGKDLKKKLEKKQRTATPQYT